MVLLAYSSLNHFESSCCCVLRLRRMFDVVDLPLCWPAEVNYHEAKAYCAWRGPHFRLLAEAEYHAILAPPVIRCLLLLSFNPRYQGSRGIWKQKN